MVDVSSGVEDAPGVKTPDKIVAFAAAARDAQYTDANDADAGA
jgi:phosphoribosylanthranilate isomerase